jgi:hypothetical protein
LNICQNNIKNEFYSIASPSFSYLHSSELKMY